MLEHQFQTTAEEIKEAPMAGRATSIHPPSFHITRALRERLHQHSGRIIWFTGLSGAGKSTIANALEVRLHAQGISTYLLDGDHLRIGLNRDLGFSKEDRIENIRRVAEVARMMLDAGLVVLACFISPFRAERELARMCIGKENFFEVFVDAPLALCEQRDPKGLYKKARAGQLRHFTGIDQAYEVPLEPQCHLVMNELADPEVAVEVLLSQIMRRPTQPSPTS